MEEKRMEKVKLPKRGLFIAAVTLCIAACVALAIEVIYAATLPFNDDVGLAVSVVLFIIVVGWFSTYPAIVCSILSIVFSAVALKHAKTKGRIATLIVAILTLIVAVGIFIGVFVFLGGSQG